MGATYQSKRGGNSLHDAFGIKDALQAPKGMFWIRRHDKQVDLFGVDVVPVKRDGIPQHFLQLALDRREEGFVVQRLAPEFDDKLVVHLPSVGQRLDQAEPRSQCGLNGLPAPLGSGPGAPQIKAYTVTNPAMTRRVREKRKVKSMTSVQRESCGDWMFLMAKNVM